MTLTSAAGLAGASRIGYAHASIVRLLSPSNVSRSKAVVHAVTSELCDCPEDHIEIWAVPLPRP
jgi:hypothetical protein